MPESAIQGHESEKVWKKAVAAAEKQYGDRLKKTDPDKFYAITMTIYKSMCKSNDCAPKAEGMEALLWRLEMKADMGDDLTERAMPKVNLPGKNARSWQLHSSGVDTEMRDRLKAAVNALNDGLRAATKDVWRVMQKINGYDEQKLSKAIGQSFDKHLQPVMLDYSDTGASDTEPRYEAAQSLIDFVKNHYGISGWTKLGDWV